MPFHTVNFFLQPFKDRNNWIFGEYTTVMRNRSESYHENYEKTNHSTFKLSLK